MKSYISLFLAAMLFISQSVFLSNSTQANEQTFLNEDTRLLIADQIESKGIELQNLADFISMDAAMEAFEGLVNHNLGQMKDKMSAAFSNISEENANTQIAEIRSNLSQHEENLLSIANTKSLTSKQKLNTIYEALLIQSFTAQKTQLINSINKFGFKKAFASLADQWRSRSFWGTVKDVLYQPLIISLLMAASIWMIGDLIWPGSGGTVLFVTLFVSMLWKCRHNFFTCE